MREYKEGQTLTIKDMLYISEVEKLEKKIFATDACQISTEGIFEDAHGDSCFVGAATRLIESDPKSTTPWADLIKDSGVSWEELSGVLQSNTGRRGRIL